MAVLNFDANNYQPYEGNTGTLPEGWYKLAIEKSEIKPNKQQTGSYLSLQVTVLEGKNQNRKLFDNLNIQNQNAIAQEIAFKKLSSYTRAVGKMQIKTSEELHNIPFWGFVKLKPAKGEYEASNEITSWKHISESPEGVTAQPATFSAPIPPVQVPVPPAQPQATPANSAPTTQPWNQPSGNNQPWNQAATNAAGAAITESVNNAPAIGAAPPWAQPAEAQ